MEATQTPAELKTQQNPSMSAERIGTILLKEGSGLTADEYDEINESEDVKSRRVDRAKSMLAVCEHLWLEGAEELDLVTQTLGDGSRDGE